MKLKKKLKNELLYAGLTREEVLQVREPINRTNHKAVFYWSLFVGLFWLLSLVMSFYSYEYVLCRCVFLLALVSSLLTGSLAVFVIEALPWLLKPTMQFLVISILGAGLGIALCQPHSRTVTLIALSIFIPSCFISSTLDAILLQLVTVFAYVLLARRVLDPAIFTWGLTNLLIFSAAGVLTSHVINRSRFRRYVLADSSQRLAYMQANYNTELHKEVELKTRHMVALQNQMVMGLATMVESRDNSTGGHVRRTSKGVELIVEAMRRDPSLQLSDSFCEKLIQAAPMHDLGKIAVDDCILRKPGRYTPQEYEQMKTHAAEGARILSEILAGTDEEFLRIAVNVAHYHHEWMNGEGYPEGLYGKQIPLEARIMAIADVYDALVSKRVYKESYSLERANKIILSEMGSHFDPALKKYYLEALPQLESFYQREISDNEGRQQMPA